jgi:hypothetical protein
MGSRDFHGSKTDTSTGTPVKAKATVSSTFVAAALPTRTGLAPEDGMRAPGPRPRSA